MALRFNDFLREEIEFEDANLVNELSDEIRGSVPEHKQERVKSPADLRKLIGNPVGVFMQKASDELFSEFEYWQDTERAKGNANV